MQSKQTIDIRLNILTKTEILNLLKKKMNENNTILITPGNITDIQKCAIFKYENKAEYK